MTFYFLFSCLFPLPDALQAHGRQWQGFRVEYAPQEEDSARPRRCHQPIRYLCNLNYTIGCRLCHRKQTMLL